MCAADGILNCGGLILSGDEPTERSAGTVHQTNQTAGQGGKSKGADEKRNYHESDAAYRLSRDK